jgi:hypothetical protein
MTSLDYYLITASLFVTVLGGAVAYFKRDYITRGMAICFFTSLWGVLAMVLSPSSKARVGDEHDRQFWPSYSWVAVGGTLLTIAVVLLLHRLGTRAQ